MTRTRAIEVAQRKARRTGEFTYVVWSDEVGDVDGDHYQVASEFDVDTFYAGASVLVAIGPDGTVEP